jgi:hypothetical protein
VQDSHGGKVKHVKVLERVYEPRRLRTAWQHVKQNAGAAGIDQMTVEAFERRKDDQLADKATSYQINVQWFSLLYCDGKTFRPPLLFP